MTEIQWLAIEGYRSYGARQKIEFRPGVFLLTGENRDRGNSAAAGKSSLFKGLTTVLFEENDDNSIKDAGINTLALEAGELIETAFAVDGVYYHAAYSRRHPVAGTAWRLHRWDGAAWVEMSGATLGDTKGLLGAALRMTYDQFVNYAYVPQHRVAEFIQRTDKERKLVFSKLLGLEVCDSWLDAARRLRKEADDVHRQAAARWQVIRDQLAAAEASGVGDPEEQAKLTAQLAADRKYREETRAEIARDDVVIGQYQAGRAAADRAVKLKYEIQQQAEIRDKLQERITAVAIPDGGGEALVAQRARQAEIAFQSGDAQARLNRVESIGETCPDCERKLPKANQIKLVEKYSQLVLKLKDELVVVITEVRRLEALEAERTAAIHKHDALVAEHIALGRYLLSLQTEHKTLSATEAPTIDIDAYRADKATREGYVEEVNSRILAAELRLQQLKDLETRRKTLMSEMLMAEAIEGASEIRVTALRRCEEAIGDKGFRSFKIRSSREEFNQSLAKYLSVLTQGEMQAELVTDVPRADGKGTKQELDILVRDGEKASVPIRQYSGAEQAALSLAITGAFWDLAAHQANCGINLLLLDEPFANLDTWGEQQACRLFAYLREQDPSRTIVVVTNRREVRDSGAFDGEIRAIKENHLSRLEEYDLRGEH